jgi:transposase, IS30 family
MPGIAPNKLPTRVKREYFQLIRLGHPGAEAARRVGVSMSCGSLWFIDAGSMDIVERTPISSRFFTQDDRIEIADGMAHGQPVKVIAARIDKSFQSVYRDIARNRKPEGSYQPWFTHNQAHMRRRRPRRRAFDEDAGLRAVVAAKLAKRWSPGQISRWLRRRYPKTLAWHVCAETIYEAVYRGLIVAVDAANLRSGRTYRHRHGRGRSKDGSLKQSTVMRSIHDRPAHVESRRQAGHWEGDLIVGSWQRSAIATLIERKTRLTVLVRLHEDHSAQTVGDALIAAFQQLPPQLRRTLTWDQGNEMFQHARIETATGMRIYFADPHSPWQRGTNENTNGLLRQYFPKSTELSRWSQGHLDDVATELNDRPRECLNDLSPEQAMRRLGHPRQTRLIHDHR